MVSTATSVEILMRLILSAVIGGLIGMEREANNRPAGLRTHVLVTLGSSLIMLLSMYGFDGLGAGGKGGDPARLAAQVVSGIGFLGAGTILRTENKVSGLTTAASLWVCGGIGLAIGGGYYLGGLATAAIVLFTLRSLGFVEKKFFKKKYRVLIIQFMERPGLIGDVGHVLGNNSVLIKDIRIVREDDQDDEDELTESSLSEVYFTVKLPGKFTSKRFFDDLLGISGVVFARWEDGKKRYPHNRKPQDHDEA
ncbi:MgtC/SapB family protein [Anoxynatronum buryatiense]|uniref:Mg2+ transporter-C (MgtC) family protein n=1 Tax=Anoxynatronum buryatiense TaxID=489973 RepID=A0AA45WTN3_9CLOT|nr:MgtC/SapB family protein [Anoxynatronum buryatiense]SMP44049.1 putative Mg2+ transporter-C (MgtC) family protein [Anoxynatronum buryatiense]